MLPNYIKRDDIRGIYPEELNEGTAEAIGYALGTLLKAENAQPRLAIGYDCRHGNTEIASGLARGFFLAGGSCDNFGLLSTEHVYYICGACPEYTAGAMITASHNPREYNGIKFLHGGCLPFTSDELMKIGELASSYVRPETIGSIPDKCYSSMLINFNEYAEHLLHLSGLDRREDSHRTQMRVVVLAGHGMGALAFGAIAAKLKPKGLCTVFIEPEPDGDFPNGVPNPLKEECMDKLAQLVEQYQADLGICFDGDADRAGFVDAWSQEIIPSHVHALISEARLERSSIANPVIMRNLCCSKLIQDRLQGRAEVVDTPVGHGRIKLLMRHPLYKDRCVFAGEHSGHYFYPEFNYVDSGVLTSLFMIDIVWKSREEHKSLPEMLMAWRERYSWSGEINFKLKNREEMFRLMRKVWESQRSPKTRRYQVATVPELGTVQCIRPSEEEYLPEKMPVADLKMLTDNKLGGWWFVLRPSGNEPQLRLNVEAWGLNAIPLCQQKTKEIVEIIEQP